jgi:hypothetical protein
MEGTVNAMRRSNAAKLPRRARTSAQAAKTGGERAAARSAERGHDQAATQQRKAGCSKDEESLGITITVVTHDTPVASAPGHGANQLIKNFGIPPHTSRVWTRVR